VVPPSTSACPVDPLVFKVTAPVNALFVVSRVISLLLALVVNDEVPLIPRAPLSVIEPPVEVAIRLPLKVKAAKSKSLLSLIVTFAKVPPELKATVFEKVLALSR
jgi:hypothetical protein